MSQERQTLPAKKADVKTPQAMPVQESETELIPDVAAYHAAAAAGAPAAPDGSDPNASGPHRAAAHLINAPVQRRSELAMRLQRTHGNAFTRQAITNARQSRSAPPSIVQPQRAINSRHVGRAAPLLGAMLHHSPARVQRAPGDSKKEAFSLAYEQKLDIGAYIKLKKLTWKLEGTLSKKDTSPGPTQPSQDTTTGGAQMQPGKQTIGVAEETKTELKSSILSDVNVAGTKLKPFDKSSGEIKYDPASKEASGKYGVESGFEAPFWNPSKLTFSAGFTIIGLKVKDGKPDISFMDANLKASGTYTKKLSESEQADLKFEVAAEIGPDWKTIIAEFGAGAIADAAVMLAPVAGAAFVIYSGFAMGADDADRTKKIYEGCIKARHSAIGYVGGYMDGSTGSTYPEAQAAAQKGNTDLIAVAQKKNMSVADARKEMTADDFQKIYQPFFEAAIAQVRGIARQSVIQWRAEHPVLAIWKTQEQQFSEVERDVAMGRTLQAV